MRLNPTWGTTNKGNTVLNLAIGLIFAYLVLCNIFHIVCFTLNRNWLWHSKLFYKKIIIQRKITWGNVYLDFDKMSNVIDIVSNGVRLYRPKNFSVTAR